MKVDHAFEPPPLCAENQDSCDFWHESMRYNQRCGLPASAHPVSHPRPWLTDPSPNAPAPAPAQDRLGEIVAFATDCTHVSQHDERWLMACAPCVRAALERVVRECAARADYHRDAILRHFGLDPEDKEGR